MDPVNTFLTLPRVSLVLKTYRQQRSKSARVITSGALAHIAGIRPIGTSSSLVHSTTSETLRLTTHAISWSLTRNTAAPAAANTSMRTSATWPTRTPGTPGAWCTWRCGWWWKTDCHIAPRPGTCGETTGSLYPGQQYRTGLKRRGKKTESFITSEYLHEALANFSGYIAADELYDGPFCVLSIVDNHNFRRLFYEVLNHDPTKEDIRRFLQRFKAALDARGLELQGITTDGSPLYPEPIADVFGVVAHQVCEFHIIKEINKAIIKAVAQARRALKERQPRLKRGRPSSKAARRAARKKKRLQAKVADLFKHRYLFVKHALSRREKKVLRRITRALPHLRVLRAIVDEVYRLFDRRCRTETALEKLARLRRRVRRFKTLVGALRKLFSPNLEKALTFLDDKLLPSTSNAVERGNRRHRKMQKSIYRVRTRDHISQRIAIDMQREAQAECRLQTTVTLHSERRKVLCSR